MQRRGFLKAIIGGAGAVAVGLPTLKNPKTALPVEPDELQQAMQKFDSYYVHFPGYKDAVKEWPDIDAAYRALAGRKD